MSREVYQSGKLLAINGNQAVCSVATYEAMKKQPDPELLGWDDVGMFNSIPDWFKEDTSKEYDDEAYYDYSGGYTNHGLAGYGTNKVCRLEVDNYVPFNLNNIKEKLNGEAGLILYRGVLGNYHIMLTGDTETISFYATRLIETSGTGSEYCYFIVGDGTHTTTLFWGCPEVISKEPKKGLVPIYVYTVGGEYHV